jgi:hypothetical protein
MVILGCVAATHVLAGEVASYPQARRFHYGIKFDEERMHPRNAVAI